MPIRSAGSLGRRGGAGFGTHSSGCRGPGMHWDSGNGSGVAFDAYGPSLYVDVNRNAGFRGPAFGGAAQSGGRVVQYDPWVGTQWDLADGVGGRWGRRRYGARRGNQVLVGLVALAVLFTMIWWMW